MGILDFTLRLLTGLVLGAAIGLERHWRQKRAGLRTNTLVSLGATAFMLLSIEIGGDASARVASYIISGIGFFRGWCHHERWLKRSRPKYRSNHLVLGGSRFTKRHGETTTSTRPHGRYYAYPPHLTTHRPTTQQAHLYAINRYGNRLPVYHCL